MRLDRVRRLLTLASYWRVLTGAAVMQIAVALSLRFATLSSLRQAGVRMRPLFKIVLPGTDDRVAWAIEATGRRLGIASTCLVRALVGEMRLGSTERPVYLVIGVKRTVSGGLFSHAWLRDRERVLIGGPIDESLTTIVQSETAA
jgi:hypothetical protein